VARMAVTFDDDSATAARIERLRQEWEAATPFEVVRRAIAFTDEMVQHKGRGGRIILEDVPGGQRVVWPV